MSAAEVRKPPPGEPRRIGYLYIAPALVVYAVFLLYPLERAVQVFFALIPTAVGLVLASIVARARVRGLTFFRTVIFLPQVVAMVVVGRHLAADLRARRPAQRPPATGRPR